MAGMREMMAGMEARIKILEGWISEYDVDEGLGKLGYKAR